MKLFHPKLTWDKYRQTAGEKIIYLTFDDGPIPEVTPWVLQTLKKFNAKATFFCIGENIVENPEVFNKVLAEGHQVGNHTYNHLNDRQASFDVYIENIEKASETISEFSSEEQKIKLFRPPFGKITRKSSRHLRSKGYEIIMFDLVAYDWEANVNVEKNLNTIKKKTRPGSIIVLHDSLKAEKNLKRFLPEILEYFGSRGYAFEVL
ncbi:MAG: polysaccharide deacetylase family protein [Leeuwenhoekiella sp.]